MVHPRTAPGEEATDRRIVASGGDELEPALADEDRRRLHTLLDDRLAMLELRAEERLVRRDRLVQIGDGDAEVMDAPHPRDAIRAGVLVPHRQRANHPDRLRRARLRRDVGEQLLELRSVERLLLEQRLSACATGASPLRSNGR